MRPVSFDIATFVLIVSEWLATIWLAYRIGLQSMKDQHDEADREAYRPTPAGSTLGARSASGADVQFPAGTAISGSLGQPLPVDRRGRAEEPA